MSLKVHYFLKISVVIKSLGFKDLYEVLKICRKTLNSGLRIKGYKGCEVKGKFIVNSFVGSHCFKVLPSYNSLLLRPPFCFQNLVNSLQSVCLLELSLGNCSDTEIHCPATVQFNRGFRYVALGRGACEKLPVECESHPGQSRPCSRSHLARDFASSTLWSVD